VRHQRIFPTQMSTRKRRNPPPKKAEPKPKRRRVSRRRGRARLTAEELIATDPKPKTAISAAGVLFGKHGVNLDQALVSSIPHVRNANTERLLELYRTDFFYRLLAYPSQLMWIGKRVMQGREFPDEFPDATEEATDRKISERDNRLQHRLFLDCEKILKRTMTFPEGYPRSIPKAETDGIARDISNHLHTSRNTYEFRYLVLRLYHTNASFRNHISKMVPETKAEVMKRILGKMLISHRSSGFEGAMLYEDNKFPKTVQLIQGIFSLYMSQYGLLRIQESHSGPIKTVFFL